MRSVDLGLEDRYEEYVAARSALRRSSPEGVVAEPVAVPAVHVAVEFTGPLSDLTAVDFTPISLKQHSSLPFAIAFGTVPLDRVPELGDIPHVVLVEGARPLAPHLDTSVKEIRADVLHHASPSPFTGAGVVVAVIDVHFDLAHPDFRRPDGSTRVLGYWDQDPTPRPRTTGAAHATGVGWEYSKADIQEAIDGQGPADCLRVPWRKEHDKNEVFNLEHGTHVLGIAAGNGASAGNCSGPGTYVGVAPEAEILLVGYRVNVGPETTHSIGTSPHLAYALDWIWDHTEVAGRPVVVNISLGDPLGPHDGTSSQELAMDIDLLAPSRAVVVAAGNEGEAERHATGVVGGGQTETVILQLGEAQGRRRRLEIWYSRPDRLDVQMSSPGPSTATSPVVSPGGVRVDWLFDSGVGLFRSVTSDFHGNCRIEVTLVPRDGRPLPAGDWPIKLINPGVSPIEFDAWIDRNDDFRPKKERVFFTSHVSRQRTITTPGTGRQTITVGAFEEKYLLGLAGGGLMKLSGFGPTRGVRPALASKPDLVAPGAGITAAKAQRVDTSALTESCIDWHMDMDGTSMAAPHVAGVVALMFQKNPDLSAEEVRAHLRATAQPPDAPAGPLPNDEWGAGIVDAAAALAAVPSPPVPDPLHAIRPAPAGAEHRRAPSGSAPCAPGTLRAVLTALDTTTTADEEGRPAPSGETLAALVSQHFSEVRNLVVRERRVALPWHRMQGPHLVRLIGGAHVDAHTVTAVDPHTVATRLAAFLAALDRYGSQALRADVATFGPTIQAMAADRAVTERLAARLRRTEA